LGWKLSVRDSRGYGEKSYGISAKIKVNVTLMLLHGYKKTQFFTDRTAINEWLKGCYN